MLLSRSQVILRSKSITSENKLQHYAVYYIVFKGLCQPGSTHLTSRLVMAVGKQIKYQLNLLGWNFEEISIARMSRI